MTLNPIDHTAEAERQFHAAIIEQQRRQSTRRPA